MQANPASLPVARPELDLLVKQAGWRYSRARRRAWLQLGFGFGLLAGLCAVLLWLTTTEQGMALMQWMDGVTL